MAVKKIKVALLVALAIQQFSTPTARYNFSGQPCPTRRRPASAAAAGVPIPA